MKLLDYTDRKFEAINLGSNTAFIMAFTPKILILETSEELNKFKRVWEDIIQKYIEKHEEELDPGYILQDYAGWFVDPFEEESWFKRDLENGENEYEPRNLKVVDASELDDCNFCTLYDVVLGTLNSKDMYIAPEDTEYHIKLLDILFSTDELNKRMKEDTREIMKTFYNLIKEEYKNSQKENVEYFKVSIIDR